MIQKFDMCKTGTKWGLIERDGFAPGEMMAGDDLDRLCFFARILLLRLDLGLRRVFALAPLALDELLDDLAARHRARHGIPERMRRWWDESEQDKQKR